jgi:hypothetical protein
VRGKTGIRKRGKKCVLTLWAHAAQRHASQLQRHDGHRALQLAPVPAAQAPRDRRALGCLNLVYQTDEMSGKTRQRFGGLRASIVGQSDRGDGRRPA